jgi:hypothetical protein
VPASDVFYTLNVLLGFSRVSEMPAHVSPHDIFAHNVPQLVRLPVRNYAFGMALWTAASWNFDIPGLVHDRIRARVLAKDNWNGFRAQDLGMLLIGVVAQAARDPKWSRLATDLAGFLRDRYFCGSGLFRDALGGFRQRYGSFATNTYLTLASYIYGEHANDDRFIDMANRCTRKLIHLQGADGEWPWFFDAVRGVVVDFYEVYSVHQYGMAPAFLEHAEAHDVGEARGALTKGFRWTFGSNQLHRLMFVPELSLSIRSQVRKFERGTNKIRMLRALKNSMLGRSDHLTGERGVALRLECRSYELGWVLWSFGQRKDLPQLTTNDVFTM